jgi:hypothetical protein
MAEWTRVFKGIKPECLASTRQLELNGRRMDNEVPNKGEDGASRWEARQKLSKSHLEGS